MNLPINNKVRAVFSPSNEEKENWWKHGIITEMITKTLAANLVNQITKKINGNITGFMKPDSEGHLTESGFEVEVFVFTREELTELLSTK